MSSTVTESTRAAIDLSSYEALTTSFGLVAIGLLILLLVQKEILRTSDNDQVRARTRVLDMAIAPLLLVFALIMIVRLAIIIS